MQTQTAESLKYDLYVYLHMLKISISIFISVFNQIDAQNLFHNKFYFMALHVSSTCAHHQEVKMYYTASGIITPIGVMMIKCVVWSAEKWLIWKAGMLLCH